jgi:cytochrome c-type biogenesis protein CcmH
MKLYRVIAFLLLLTCYSTYALHEMYPFSSLAQKKQFSELLGELRCLVCQNESLADSNATLAQDLRQEVYKMVQQKKSSAEIKRYLVDRYGNFILFKPPLNTETSLLWGTPVLMLLIGFLILLRFTRKKR